MLAELFSSVLGITCQKNIPFSSITSNSLYSHKSHAFLSRIQIHFFSCKQWLLYCMFWRFRLYTQDIFCILIKIHNVKSIIIISWCNFHLTSLDYMGFFLFLQNACLAHLSLSHYHTFNFLFVCVLDFASNANMSFTNYLFPLASH